MLRRVRRPTFGPFFQMVNEGRPGQQITCAADAFAVLKSDAQSDREWFQALYLDPKNRLILQALEAIGTIDSAGIHPREIARRALACGAAAVIFGHNHPSGDPEPSLCDRELTRDLVLAMGLLQIKVLDHIIVGARYAGQEQTYFSFGDQGLIEDYNLAASSIAVFQRP